MTDVPDSDIGLEDVLMAAAEDLDGVERDEGVWRVGGVPFASLEGTRAEFRLDPLVARAALHTPDTSESPRGTDWVAFAPDGLDDAAIDRAEAWFLSAHRRATRGGASTA
jgi:hypothetical protein